MPSKKMRLIQHTGRRARARLRHLALCLLLAPALSACQGGPRTDNSPAAPSPSPAASALSTERPAFDGERAFAHVKRMVETGPRPAGSAELARTRQYLVGELEAAGLKVTTDEFTAQTPAGPRQMANVTAELAGRSSDLVIIASHYDTKPFREFRFVGANDGGSSTGALVEIARTLAASGQPPTFTYWFVFFDGEEPVCRNWDDCKPGGQPDNTYGSRRYVARLQEQKELGRVRALILLDMIGYKDLAIPREGYSTPWLTDIIWETARSLGYGRQFPDTKSFVEDDHIPFLRQGVPAVDLIQLNDYIDLGYWHTAEDTLDKISPRSLQIVGETVLASLPRIERRLLQERPAQLPAER